MAYELPSTDDLKARFPEFADVADDTIEPFIDAASIWADASWFERDYPYALIYLAAHYLTMYQRALASGATSGGGGGTAGSGDVQTFLSQVKFEDFLVQYGNAGKATQSASQASSGSASAALLASTSYGLLYQQLLKRQGPAMAIV